MGGILSHEEDKEPVKNLRFYRNDIKSDYFFGYKIEQMLTWTGKYGRLEDNHDYIQWLFPIPESRGVNALAQQLYEDEAKAIREDDITRNRVLRAYKMMLDFYGMCLHPDTGGIVMKKSNYVGRYKHLNRSTHNYKRITRILISLGELGFEDYQVPWVDFLMEEAIVTKDLWNLDGGCMHHWIEAIKDEKGREQMRRKYDNLKENPRTLSDKPVEAESVDNDKHESIHTSSKSRGDDSLIKTNEPDQELLKHPMQEIICNSDMKKNKAPYLKDSNTYGDTDSTQDHLPASRLSEIPTASFSNDASSAGMNTNPHILEPNCTGAMENENVHCCENNDKCITNQPSNSSVVNVGIKSTSPASTSFGDAAQPLQSGTPFNNIFSTRV